MWFSRCCLWFVQWLKKKDRDKSVKFIWFYLFSLYKNKYQCQKFAYRILISCWGFVVVSWFCSFLLRTFFWFLLLLERNISKSSIETLYVSENTFPIRLLESNHVINLQQWTYVGQFPVIIILQVKTQKRKNCSR